MFTFSARKSRRRPSLTPMIDVVFLLLVFFMLAARFGQDLTLQLSTSGGAATYDGPPRLVTINGENIALNGLPVEAKSLADELAELMQRHDDTVFLLPTAKTDLQELVDVIDMLTAAGITTLSIVNQP